jgi:hypothetical protein
MILRVFVIEKWSETPISKALVKINGYEAETNDEGWFEIDVPAGNYSVSATTPEHEEMIQSLNLVSPMRLVLILKPIFRAL